eukprot:1309654-Amphidinium_carterae.1
MLHNTLVFTKLTGAAGGDWWFSRYPGYWLLLWSFTKLRSYQPPKVVHFHRKVLPCEPDWVWI